MFYVFSLTKSSTFTKGPAAKQARMISQNEKACPFVVVITLMWPVIFIQKPTLPHNNVPEYAVHFGMLEIYEEFITNPSELTSIYEKLCLHFPRIIHSPT